MRRYRNTEDVFIPDIGRQVIPIAYEFPAKLCSETFSVSEELEIFVNRIKIRRSIDNIDAMTAFQAMAPQRKTTKRSIGFPQLSAATALSIDDRMMKTTGHQIVLTSTEREAQDFIPLLVAQTSGPL